MLHWKIEDADFHVRQAEAERRSAANSTDAAKAEVHRLLAFEHEIAAAKALAVTDVPVFDETEFLRFALRVAVPATTAR